MTYNLNHFIREFTGITMTLDWLALAAHAPEIRILPISTRCELGQLYTPWREKADGSYADGWCEAAEPLRVNSVRFPDRCEHELSEFPYRSETLKIPCYELPNGEYLILDGNQRAVSLFRSKCSINVEAWIIKGPIDQGIMPDLGKWQR